MGARVETPRVCVVSVRLTLGEAEALVREAKAKKIPLSEILRLRLFGEDA